MKIVRLDKRFKKIAAQRGLSPVTLYYRSNLLKNVLFQTLLGLGTGVLATVAVKAGVDYAESEDGKALAQKISEKATQSADALAKVLEEIKGKVGSKFNQIADAVTLFFNKNVPPQVSDKLD